MFLTYFNFSNVVNFDCKQYKIDNIIYYRNQFKNEFLTNLTLILYFLIDDNISNIII